MVQLGLRWLVAALLLWSGAAADSGCKCKKYPDMDIYTDEAYKRLQGNDQDACCAACTSDASCSCWVTNRFECLLHSTCDGKVAAYEKNTFTLGERCVDTTTSTTTEKPTTAEPTTAEPTTAEPTTAEPTTTEVTMAPATPTVTPDPTLPSTSADPCSTTRPDSSTTTTTTTTHRAAWWHFSLGVSIAGAAAATGLVAGAVCCLCCRKRRRRESRVGTLVKGSVDPEVGQDLNCSMLAENSGADSMIAVKDASPTLLKSRYDGALASKGKRSSGEKLRHLKGLSKAILETHQQLTEEQMKVIQKQKVLAVGKGTSGAVMATVTGNIPGAVAAVAFAGTDFRNYLQHEDLCEDSMAAMQAFQQLVDDVSSVSSSENGRWRYKSVWEPKLHYIEEDLNKGLDVEVIRDKYDLYDAADEALEWHEANLLLPSVAAEVRRVGSLVAQRIRENEAQRERLTTGRAALTQEQFDEEVAAYTKVQSTLRAIGGKCSAAAASLERAHEEELPSLDDLQGLLVQQRELASKVGQCCYVFDTSPQGP